MTDHVRSLLPRYGRLPRQLVRDPDMPDRAVRLFGLLDDYADQEGKAFPSRATIADAMGCSTDSVDRAIKALEQGGWIIREVRRREDKTYDSTLYTLTMGGRTGAATGRTGAEGVAAPVPTEGTPEKENPPTPPRKRRAPAAQVADDDPAFVQFWSLMPRKVGRGAARTSWLTALAKVDGDSSLLIAAARRYAGGIREIRYACHPSTWLNQERWADVVQPETVVGARRPNVRSKAEECPIHLGEHRDACRGCAADAKAVK
jgi:hypothetical protein